MPNRKRVAGPNSKARVYRRGDMTGAQFDDWMMRHGWSNSRLAATTRTTARTITLYRTGQMGIPGMFTIAIKYALSSTPKRKRKGSIRTSLADSRRKEMGL